MTPLLIAVCCDDNVDLVDFLISKGCDVWKKDRVIYQQGNLYYSSKRGVACAYNHKRS